jgi:thiopeptide-type bacteriocin biosynthesis protein
MDRIGEMPDEACLYAAMRAPKESHDRLLREGVAPLVREILGHGDLDSFFFVRYNLPEWQLRFRVLGRRRWVEQTVRPRVEEAIEPFLRDGTVESVEYGEYEREYDRYGGPEGMALAERIFLHDSVACLDLLDAEARGALLKPRREYSLVHTERFLDLLGFDPERRLEFYRFGSSWAFEEKIWTEDDLPRLEAQYAKVREGLRELLFGDAARDPAGQHGGEEPARISRVCIEAIRPVAGALLEAHAAGRISQDLVNLAWSYTHMHCNRLGIDPVPEAILRYLVCRLYEEMPPAV